MLARTLQHLIDSKTTTAKEIGELAGVSTSTVYRWINRESQPDFDSIRLLVRHLPQPQAQEAILAVFTAGCHWQFTHAQVDLDVNQDGKVDENDALDACIETVRAACESMQEIRNGTRQGRDLTSDETLRILTLLNHVAQHCTITQRVLMDIAESRQKRKLKLAR